MMFVFSGNSSRVFYDREVVETDFSKFLGFLVPPGMIQEVVNNITLLKIDFYANIFWNWIKWE